MMKIAGFRVLSQKKAKYDIYLFLNEYPAACCGWDGQETDLRKAAYPVYK